MCKQQSQVPFTEQKWFDVLFQCMIRRTESLLFRCHLDRNYLLLSLRVCAINGTGYLPTVTLLN